MILIFFIDSRMLVINTIKYQLFLNGEEIGRMWVLLIPLPFFVSPKDKVMLIEVHK